jgi:hypothetical protein
MQESENATQKGLANGGKPLAAPRGVSDTSRRCKQRPPNAKTLFYFNKRSDWAGLEDLLGFFF